MCDEIVAVPSKERACRAKEALKHAVEAVKMVRGKIYGFGCEGSTHLELLSQMLDATVFLRAALENEHLLGPIFPAKWFKLCHDPGIESVGGSVEHGQQKYNSNKPDPEHNNGVNDKICSCNWHYFQKHLLISSRNLVNHIFQIMERDRLDLSNFPMCYPPFIDCKLDCPNCYSPMCDAAAIFEAFAMFDDLLLDAIPFVKSSEQLTSSQKLESGRYNPGVFLIPESGPQVPFEFNFNSPALTDDESTSSEARLLTAILSDTEEEYSWVSVEGDRGTGKSCALREIGQLDVVRKKYSGGVLYVQISSQTRFDRVKRIISRFIARSGSNDIAHSLDLRPNECDFVQNAANWFRNQTSRCLILLDQIGDHATDAPIIRTIMEGTRNCLVSALNRRDHYKFKHNIIFKVCKAGSERPNRLLKRYSNINLSFSNDAQKAFDDALKICDGLPLGFANVGRFIRKLAKKDCRDYPAESWRRFILAYKGNFGETCSYPTFCLSNAPRLVQSGPFETPSLMGSQQHETDVLPAITYSLRNMADILNNVCQQSIQTEAESGPFIFFSTSHHQILKHLRHKPIDRALNNYFLSLPQLRCKLPNIPSLAKQMEVSITSIGICGKRPTMQRRVILLVKPILHFQLDDPEPGSVRCLQKIYEKPILSDIIPKPAIRYLKEALISSQIAFSDNFLSFEHLESMLLFSYAYPRFSGCSNSKSIITLLLKNTQKCNNPSELINFLVNNGLGFSALGVHDGDANFYQFGEGSTQSLPYTSASTLQSIFETYNELFYKNYKSWCSDFDYYLSKKIGKTTIETYQLRKGMESTTPIDSARLKKRMSPAAGRLYMKSNRLRIKPNDYRPGRPEMVFQEGGSGETISDFQEGGSFCDILIKLCNDHSFEILGEDIDLFHKYLAPENMIMLFVPGQCKTQLFISGICVEEPMGVKLPDETDNTISFSFGSKNRKVLLNVEDLTPLGLSILMWILMPCEENICPLMKIMQGVKFNNCLRSWMMNTFRITDSEEHEESMTADECEQSLDYAKSNNIVIPLGWIHTLEVPSEFVIQHGVIGDSAVVVGLPMWFHRILNIAAYRRNRRPSPECVHECKDGTGEALIVDSDYRLVYFPNIKAKFEITALNGNAQAAGFGGGLGITRTRTPESTMQANTYTSGFNTPFISFSQFIRKKMRTRLEGCLMGRMKWLTRIFIEAGIIPNGENTGFIEKAVLMLSNNDEDLSYFNQVKMFANDDCRIHCASLRERMVKQVSNEDGVVTILIPSHQIFEEYQAECSRVDETLQSVSTIELHSSEYEGQEEEVVFDLS